MIGTTATACTTVKNTNTAKSVGSGNLDVFSTPMMIALMEQAACNCLTLPTDQSSVGTQISVEHTAASILNSTITATATITAVQGRQISFDISAKDDKKEIGKGTHTRFIIDVERFMAKLQG